MGAERARGEGHAAFGLRARRATRGRGNHDARDLSLIRSVVLYTAAGCHLCERARAVLASVREDCDFGLTEVDISGDAELEARYREWLPVVEIDGERAFVYHVPPDALRRRVSAQTGS